MEDEEEDVKGRITPEKAMSVLNAEGMNVTLMEATEILFFLQKMANIAVSKFLES